MTEITWFERAYIDWIQDLGDFASKQHTREAFQKMLDRDGLSPEAYLERSQRLEQETEALNWGSPIDPKEDPAAFLFWVQGLYELPPGWTEESLDAAIEIAEQAYERKQKK
jgi:hypothetical protein